MTFGAGQGIFTPTGLTASYLGLPIIAAFCGEVDTRPSSGGGGGLGLTSAAVGYAAGNGVAGSFGQLPGSLALVVGALLAAAAASRRNAKF